MGIENEIRELLQTGNPAASVIDRGYKKSTVYKIYNTLKTFSGKITKPEWTIENIVFNNPNIRYLPGDSITVSFYFKNNSDRDIYIVNLGIQTEWMIEDHTWYSQKINTVLKPNQKKYTSLTFSIPQTLALGEYELLFGVECQYLPVTDYREQSLKTQWSEPKIIDVKHPLTNDKLFLSHSVKNVQLVHELEKRLDNFGIETIIGEDKSEPGQLLEKKFKEQINSCTIFMALLTDEAIRSDWVNTEVNHAISISKPSILLKERDLNVKMKYEWTPFSKYDDPEKIFQTIMTSIKKIKEPKSLVSSNTLKLLGVALIGVLVGAAIVSSMRR